MTKTQQDKWAKFWDGMKARKAERRAKWPTIPDDAETRAKADAECRKLEEADPAAVVARIDAGIAARKGGRR